MSSSFKRRRGKQSSSSVMIEVSSSLDAPSSTSTTSSSSPTQQQSQPQPQRTVSSSNLPGTKPWTNNLTLTSFGLREVDSFFFSSSGGSDSGGGQPLQTSVILEEDRLTDDLSRALCRYWCAEGVAQSQMVLLGSLLPSIDESYLKMLDNNDIDNNMNLSAKSDHCEGSTPEELQDFIYSLPRNLHLDKFRAKEAKKSQSSANTASDGASMSTSKNEDNNMMGSNNRENISAIIEEDEDEDENESADENNKDEGLINAWQYRKSVQDSRSGMNSSIGDGRSSRNAVGGDGVYCHSYDLSKRMWDQFASSNNNAEDNPLATNAKIIDCSDALVSSSTTNSMNLQQQGTALFCSLWKHIQSTISKYPNTAIRLFLYRLPVGHGAVALPLLMAKIRKENLPVVVLATIRPWKWLSSSLGLGSNNKLDTLASLRSSADTTLSLDSFSSLRAPPPPEFSLLQGILTVHKCAAFNVSHYTDTVTWKRQLAERFGVKRDGRKLTVQLLHLPPEEYSKGGSSTSGVRSGGGNANDTQGHQHAAGGCSSLAGGASLDF